jgi:hypothetical protein
LTAHRIDERSQDLIEYAPVTALISLAHTVTMKNVATAIAATCTS